MTFNDDHVPERDGPPYRGTEPAHWVMRRVLNHLINRKPERSNEQYDQFGADLDLVDTISDWCPPLPAGRSTSFPPDEDTKRWLNAALDAEMKKDLEREWVKMDEDINRANNKEASKNSDDVEWELAILRARFSFGKDTKNDEPLLALLRDPAVTPIPHWVRTYLADRIAGRGPGQPPKSLGQRLEDDSKWLAEKDYWRLKNFLLDLYSKPPKRAAGNYSSVPKVALSIAADRWRVDERTLNNSIGRGEKDKRRLQSKADVT